MAKKKAAKKATKAATKKTTKKKATKAKKATKKKAAEGDEAAPKKKKKKAKRKSRAKKDENIRQVIYWGVYNHAMKLVSKFAFNQKKAAIKKAKELSPEGKPPHFVQKIKEPVEE